MTGTPRSRSWIVPPPPYPLDDLSRSLYFCEVCRLRFDTLEILLHHACHPFGPTDHRDLPP